MSQVWGVALVKNEEDIVASMLNQLINEGVDGIVVADNRSSDDTREILNDYAETAPVPVIVVPDPDRAHYQSKKMGKLCALAAEHGATWIVPCDADECWYNNGPLSLSNYLRSLPRTTMAVYATLYNHHVTSMDLTTGDPFADLQYKCVDVNPFPKVACRYQDNLVIKEGNHEAEYRGECRTRESSLEIRHFPYRSAEQMVRKARNGAEALARTTLPTFIGQHWRDYATYITKHGEEAFVQDIFWGHFAHKGLDEHIIYDPAPYQGMFWSTKVG